MFGHSYFGKSYWGPSYWGPGVGVVPPGEADCDLDVTEAPDTCEFVVTARRGGSGQIRPQPGFGELPRQDITDARLYATERPDFVHFELTAVTDFVTISMSEMPDFASVGIDLLSPVMVSASESPDRVMAKADYSTWIEYDNQILDLP